MQGLEPGLQIRNNRGEIIFTVVNPVADNGRTGKRWPGYERFFQGEGLNLEVFRTEKAAQATEAVREALKNGYRIIMAVGGDGTVNEVANGFFEDRKLINPDSGLLIFSRGTGSDYIRSLGIGRKPGDIVDIVGRSRRRFVDLGYITYTGTEGNIENKYFVNLADCGIGGETVHRIKEGSRLGGGLFTYLLAALMTLARYKNKEMRVEIDEEEVICGILNSVIIGNGGYFAGGMQIVPGADPGDGLLNILILEDLSRIEIIFNLYRAYPGNHLQHPGVNMYSGSKVKVESPEEVLLDIDGEAAGKLPLTVMVEEKKLPVYF